MMVDLNRETFDALEPSRQCEILFEGQQGVETALKELSAKVDTLIKSPWRMAIPPVSWKALAAFTLAMTALLKGDLTMFNKIIALLMGGG